MAGNIMGAIFGALEGAGKGISNSANTAKETGTGDRAVGADTTQNANGGENAMNGAVKGYTNGMIDTSDKENKNNLYGESKKTDSEDMSSSGVGELFSIGKDRDTKLRYEVK